MNTSQKPDKVIKKLSCAKCDFEVRDSEADEILAVIQSHAKRKHGVDFTLEQLRPHLHAVKE